MCEWKEGCGDRKKDEGMEGRKDVWMEKEMCRGKKSCIDEKKEVCVNGEQFWIGEREDLWMKRRMYGCKEEWMFGWRKGCVEQR